MGNLDRATTANDRLKRRFEEALPVSLIAATLLHVGVLVYFPEMTAPDWTRPPTEQPVVVQLDEIPIPKAPERLARPAVPVVSDLAAPDATLTPFDFQEAVELPPPSLEPDVIDDGRTSGFEVFTVAPRLIDPDAFQRALERVYPRALRDSGIGGTVQLLLGIDEEGRVIDASVGTTSGYEALDQAALRLAADMRFTPALNRDRKVAVMVSIPVTFRVRN